MGLFSQKAPATRHEVLERAGAARAAGKRDKAIAIYGDWLVQHPDDHEVHAKVAPLHDRPEIAWGHYSVAAEGYVAKGFVDRAVAVLKQAVQAAPHLVAAWLRIAELHVVQQRVGEAVQTLRVARAHHVRRKHRAAAARILAAWHALDAADTDVVVDLARVRRRLGDVDGALAVLAAHLARVDGRARRRVRWAMFAARPTPRALWRWLRNP